MSFIALTSTGQVSIAGSIPPVSTGPYKNPSDCSQGDLVAFQASFTAVKAVSFPIVRAFTAVFRAIALLFKSSYVLVITSLDKSVSTSEYNPALGSVPEESSLLLQFTNITEDIANKLRLKILFFIMFKFKILVSNYFRMKIRFLLKRYFLVVFFL
ncbi:hypothetical protein D3C86_1395590 [compost metagenome]